MTAFDAKFEALRQRFVGAAGGEADALERSIRERDVPDIRRIAHGLAGRSGMFGYRELGALALVVEEADDSAILHECAQLVAVLRQLGQDR